MITLEIVRFCAIECELQVSGEVSVYHMVNAYDYAQKNSVALDDWNRNKLPSMQDIMIIGALVEPKWNKAGFRTVDVRVGWDVKMPWPEVPQAMSDLVDAMEIYAPEQFFRAYEEVHPWRDGNGRSGAILYNWLNQTLDEPVWPPDYWNDSRRKPGYGAPKK